MKITKAITALLATLLISSCGSTSASQPTTTGSEPTTVEPSSEITSTSEETTTTETSSTTTSTEEEETFDPTPYLEGFEEQKNEAKERLANYLSDLTPYSDNGKEKIENIISEGQLAIENATKANEIIDILYLYFGKLDEVPNAKQEAGYVFVSQMTGESTTSGFDSMNLVSVDKEGNIIFNSLTSWGQINFGSKSRNPYKVFECDLTIDYETVQWGSADFYINRDGWNSYVVGFKNDLTTLYTNKQDVKTSVQEGDPVKDNEQVHFEVITDGDRKMVLLNHEAILDYTDDFRNEGQFAMSLWQSCVTFSNYTFKEYSTRDELVNEYSESLSKNIYTGLIAKSQEFLANWWNGTEGLSVDEQGYVVSTATGWNRQRFAESSNNNFEVFEFDLIPTFNSHDNSYIQIDFRVRDDNNKYTITLKDGSVSLKKISWSTEEGKGVWTTIVDTINSNEIASNKTLHVAILCSGWYKTVALNGKHLYSISGDSVFTYGLFGIDANQTPYKLGKATINKYETQDELSAANKLWESSYSEKFAA